MEADVEKVIKEYAAMDAMASEILSDKQQVWSYQQGNIGYTAWPRETSYTVHLYSSRSTCTLFACQIIGFDWRRNTKI